MNCNVKKSSTISNIMGGNYIYKYKKQEKKEETLTEKKKRTPDESHTNTEKLN